MSLAPELMIAKEWLKLVAVQGGSHDCVRCFVQEVMDNEGKGNRM